MGAIIVFGLAALFMLTLFGLMYWKALELHRQKRHRPSDQKTALKPDDSAKLSQDL
jgi:hypothetical protein